MVVILPKKDNRDRKELVRYILKAVSVMHHCVANYTRKVFLNTRTFIAIWVTRNRDMVETNLQSIIKCLSVHNTTK